VRPGEDGQRYRADDLCPHGMEDRSDLGKIVFDQTRVILTRDLSVMNPNLVVGAQGLVVGKLANYTLKVAFPKVTVGVSWRDCDIVVGKTGMPTDADQPKVIPKPRHMGEE
jgi:hypothetical protein